MISLAVASLIFASHGDGPYDWHMSCERWLEKKIEILQDEHLDNYNKRFLINYFRSKVEGECYDTMT